MLTIRELLSKIKWDSKLNPEEYGLFYLDRFTKELKEIPYKIIAKVEDNFLVLSDGTNIPLHRIKEVRRKNKLIWKRNV